MESKLQTYECRGRECWHITLNPLHADVGTIVYFPCGPDELDLAPAIADELNAAAAAGECEPFALAGFLSDDWNSDFSPWPAPALFKKAGEFGGNGGATLEWMLRDYLPQTQQLLGIKSPQNAIIGYSLAGLFALWSIYQTGVFSRCASCSGSLWFDGWTAYAAANTPHPVDRLYLSLGDREEKARNQVMASVGDGTRAMYERMKAALPQAEVTLEWNEGGHFDDVGGRIARALLWLMRT